MKDAIRIAGFALLALILFTVGFATRDWFSPPGVETPPGSVITEYDTIPVVIHDTTVQVVNAPARVTAHGPVVAWTDTARTPDGERIDTVLIAQPFAMQLDSILASGDTLQLRTTFPPPLMSLVVRPGPDTVQVQYRTITVTRTERPPFWEDVGKVGIAYGAGYLTRWLTEPRQTAPTIIQAAARLPPQAGNAPPLALVNLSLTL